MKAKILICLILLLSAFEAHNFRTITGVVTDSESNPLPGASVWVKGGVIGTTAGKNGNYTIQVPLNTQYLRFGFIGYKNQDVKIGTSSVISVKLYADVQSLSEVVIVGYGTQNKKSSLTAFTSSPGMQAHVYQDYQQAHTENYNPINENGFQIASSSPVTTFSIDVDRASYSNVRRFLNNGQLPPVDAVRIEELINYFDYDLPQPTGTDPIAVHTEIADSPWNPGLKLVHIGLQAKKLAAQNLPPSNLVFLIDVSGSMVDQNKLPLLKKAFGLLIEQLRPEDKVSIVVYAGAAGVVLPPTGGDKKQAIREALEQLNAGGSTAGGQGIELAYKLAQENYLPKGNKRILLATDGDFNVGVSSEGELQRLIEEKRKGGVYLSILGFGMGNYKDSHVETLADKGNGNYAYIDNIQEAKKVFVQEFGGTLFTVAKDVKLQIEFNPAHVQAYRLIGYENRALTNEAFKDDQKDAGEMGSGHSVTAIYEIVPAGVDCRYLTKEHKLKYQSKTGSGNASELMTLKIRYKKPDSETSVEREYPISNTSQSLVSSSENFRFSASVAEFGLLLRQSEFRGSARYDEVIRRAKAASGKDEEGYKAEFVRLVKLTQSLDTRKETAVADNDLRK